jgi:ABC-2 type transport system ATP-binding protein
MKLEVKNISKYYGKHLALSDFSMTINSGEVIGLIGKNGSGKTTLLNCIVNHIHLSSGEIFVNDQNLLKHKQLISKFGVLIESSFLDYLNAYGNLELLMLADGITNTQLIDQQLHEVLELVGLHERKREFVKSYSFGMKQRLGLAQALLNNKELLILDEPLVGLDVMGRELVKKIIVDKAKTEGKAVIFSDHNLSEVKDICDRIVYLEDGKKMYDGVFDDERKYVITLERINHDIQSSLMDACNNDLIIDHNVIHVKQVNCLNKVLKILVYQGITITDFEIVEGSLIRLFKGDTDNVEQKGHMEHRIQETLTS